MAVKRQAIGTPDRHGKGTPHRPWDRLVPVANRRVPRASRSALTSDGAARVGGACLRADFRAHHRQCPPRCLGAGTQAGLPTRRCLSYGALSPVRQPRDRGYRRGTMASPETLDGRHVEWFRATSAGLGRAQRDPSPRALDHQPGWRFVHSKRDNNATAIEIASSRVQPRGKLTNECK